MRRKLLYLSICMPFCLLLVPDGAPVALSLPRPDEKYTDDGKKLPDADTLPDLAAKVPVAFLDACLKRQVREIKGYSGVLRKTERIKGKSHPEEVVDFWFREEPYSVMMKWREGARSGKASLFVEGQNKNEVAVVSNTRLALTVNVNPEGRLAADGGRYSIREFSMRQATERTHRAWKAAKDKDSLKVEFLGKKAVKELNDRDCYVLKRTCNPPEEEGVVTVQLFFDAETWLQAGTILTDAKGKLIGQYYFSDLKINPDFAPGQFERAMLKK